MENIWAENFYEILPTISERSDLAQAMKNLIATELILGKSLEGQLGHITREEKFKSILISLLNQQISLEDSFLSVESELGRIGSPYSSDNRVFAKGWGERLIRTQLSRFYNHAVLSHLISKNNNQCFIPHSTHEKAGSLCIQYAGSNHETANLLEALIDVYSNGNWERPGVKIPQHPHCTHVIKPL